MVTGENSDAGNGPEESTRYRGPRHSAKSRAKSTNYPLRRTFFGLLALTALVVVGLAVTSNRGGINKQKDRRVTSTSAPTTSDTTASLPLLSTPTWRVAWGSPMAWGDGTAVNTTVRELVTVGIGGVAVRVRLSNLDGNVPLDVGAASVAQDLQNSQLVPGTIQSLTFSGAPTVSIPVGQVVYSDPVNMAVSTGETLAVSVYVSNADVVTVHPCCTEANVSFFTPNNGGNQVTQSSNTPFTFSSPWPRWVDALDILQEPNTAPAQGSIVVLGDSISEGFNAPIRWTDILQKRIDMLPTDEQRAVINEAITANTLLTLPDDYSKTGGGQSGLDRMAQDVIDQSGVSEVIIFLGTNDLFFGASADQIIAGYEQAIAMLHEANLKVIGVTLLPRMAGKEPWNPQQQQYLQQINTWIMGQGNFDGYLDFAQVIADDYDGSCIPTSIYPPFDSGDHLHPSAAGQTAMADSVAGPQLGLPTLGYVPELVLTTPTKNCLGVAGIPGPVAMPTVSPVK